MKSKEYIIGGIDTDCGKTYITGILAKKLYDEGRNVITAKLIQTGCKGISEDIIEHRRLMGVDLLPEDRSGQTCPVVLSYPASPHLASEIDKKEIDLNLIRNSQKELAKKYETVLIEAAGGLMVPITKDYLTIDYITDNKLPLILVSSSRLGSINHTLLSIEVCLQRNIEVPYVVYNQFPEHDTVIAQDTFKLLKGYAKENLPETTVVYYNEINSPIKL